MAFDSWPIDILIPRDKRFSPMSGAARGGGRTLNGSVRVTNWQAGGLWRGRYVQVGVYEPEDVLLAEAIEAILDCGAEPMAIPLLPLGRAPFSNPTGPTPHSDGSPFSDGGLYGGANIMGVLSTDADCFATSLAFTWAGPVHILGGDFEVMSPDGPRAHRIKRFLSREGTSGAFVYEVEVSPPLRCDLIAGATLDFENPRCMMRLANPEAFAPVLEFGWYGFIDADFVEA